MCNDTYPLYSTVQKDSSTGFRNLHVHPFPSSPCTMATTNLLPVSIVLSSPESHTVRILQY